MASPSECFQRVLGCETELELLLAREELETALRASDVLQFALFQELLADVARPDLATDLAELRAFVAALDAEEPSGEFPAFMQLRALVGAREARAAAMREQLAQRLGVLAQPVARLVKILDKVLWVERFVKMRSLHKWFMLAITDYVEVVEYQEPGRLPPVPKPPSTLRHKAALVLLRPLTLKPLRISLARWRQHRPDRRRFALERLAGVFRLGLSQNLSRFRRNATQRRWRLTVASTAKDWLLTEPETPSYGEKQPRSFWLKMFNCLCYQRTRPSFTLSSLDVTL